MSFETIINALQLPLLGRGKEILGVSHGTLQPACAEIIGAALEHRVGEIYPQHLLQKRQILVHQLFLQVDRVGADDRFLVHLCSIEDRRHQISHALAHTGAAFHDELVPAQQSFGYSYGHLLLLGAVFKILGVSQDALRRKKGTHLLHQIRL